MTDHPIIMSAPMVRALLEGRKTQTRRLAFKPVRSNNSARPSPWTKVQPGDRIWVRETCQALEAQDGTDCVRYEADQKWLPIDNTAEAADRWIDLFHYRKTRGAIVPAIHMPRWASRITLDVTAVKIERLQDISEEDAIAEGVKRGLGLDTRWRDYEVEHLNIRWQPNARSSYASLWRLLHGDGSWGANPEVIALTFTVHQGNIDRMPGNPLPSTDGKVVAGR